MSVRVWVGADDLTHEYGGAREADGAAQHEVEREARLAMAEEVVARRHLVRVRVRGRVRGRVCGGRGSGRPAPRGGP